MKFEKKGLIFCPNGEEEWMQNSFMTPVPILIEGSNSSKDKIRIFGGIRDKDGVSRIGFIDVKASNPSEIIYVHKKPILDIGEKGCFDDNGVVPIASINVDEKFYLYYIGFQLGVQIPYYMFCGLSISDDNLSFKRYSKVPILDRSDHDLYARCGCHVLKDEDSYKIYYIGSLDDGWIKDSNNKLLPSYTMKISKSIDGIAWDNLEVKSCLNFKNKYEHGFGRPFVWKNKNKYKMLYSIRSLDLGYSIGYGESNNGIDWERMDEKMKGLEKSSCGWDNEMVCYPNIFSYKEKIYCFYNGNGMGKTGVGYAEIISGF